MTSPNEMDDAAKAVGELILWANMLDDQLNKVLIGALVLPDHPMIEPVVAQLDIRPKVEILKGRMKLLPDDNPWRENFLKWLKKVEKVNENRNIVAHHRIELDGGKVRLMSTQISKILKSLDSTMKTKPPKGLADIKRWVEEAGETYEQGRNIIKNIRRFRDEAIKKAAPKRA